MKKKKNVLILIFALILVVFVFPYAVEFCGVNISHSKTAVNVSIPSGATTKDIAKILKSAGLIKSEFTFTCKVKTGEYSNKLNYGNFTFTKDMTIDQIIKTLAITANQNNTFTITIPEGYSAQQIAKLLDEKNLVKKDAFLLALSDSYDYDFLSKIPQKKYDFMLQGFLFPSTYEFYNGASAHDIIDKMLSEFSKRYLSHASSFDNVFEVVTKASVIEKEAKLDSERPIIAGVINNRLNKNMALQIDACVVYAVSEGMYDVNALKNADLLTDSPYNTYKNKGLPIGPICNPGINSVLAALNPDSNEYFYYHTDENKKDGSHIFTKTFESHIKTMN